MNYSIYRVTRAALLGTTALVAAGQSSGLRADVTIAANTTNTVSPGAAGDNVTITNTGSVTGTFVGIQVLNPTDAGTILNQGTITVSSVGIQVTASGGVSGGITNEGAITGAFDGIQVFGLSSVGGGITNQSGGLIGGASNAGINISGTSTVLGGVTNAGSILSVQDGIFVSGTGTSVSGGISNSGAISANRSGIVLQSTATLSGSITNDGLIAGGSNGIVVSSNSDVSGGLSNRGTISGVIGISVDTSSTITGGITNRGVITGTGGTSIQLSPADNILTLGTGSVLNGTVQAGLDDADVLNLIETGSEDDLLIGFEQLNMNGEEWTLTSDLTLVEGVGLFGDANINSGILYMNGTLTAPGGVSAIGGTLAGSGDIVANVTIGADGSIAPGNSIGVLNVTGDVTLGAGSFFDVEVEGSTADLMTVTGDVTIDPTTTVNVIPLSTDLDIVDQVIIDAGGTINANFQNIEPNGLMASTELRGTSQILLTIVAPDPVEVSDTTGANDSFAFQDALMGPIGGIGTYLIGPEMQLWAKGIYESNKRDNSAEFAGFDQETYGVVIGLDRAVTSSLQLGGALGYTSSEIDIRRRLGEEEIEALYAGLYGIYDKNAFHAKFGAQIGWQEKDLSRPVLVSGTTTNVTGETDGQSYGAHAKGGWRQDWSEQWGTSLNLNAAYIHQTQDDYIDTAGVSFGTFDSDTFRLGPSLDLVGTFQSGTTRLTPRASIGYLQQWTGADDEVEVTFASGATRTSAIADRDEGFATFGVWLDAMFEDRVTAFVGYDGEYGDDETRNRITAGFRFGL